MNRKYLFFVNADYCYSIFRPVQDEILKRGGEVAWFFAPNIEPALFPNELHLADEKQVFAFVPDVVFSAADWLPYYFPGLKVMLFHGMAINKRADEEDVHYKIRGWYDLYCTHAKTDTDKFSLLAKQHKNFYVYKTGWPKIDALYSAKEASFSVKKKTLFFASTFTPSISAAAKVADTLKNISLNNNWRVIATLHPLINKTIQEKYTSLSEGEDFIYLPASANLHEYMKAADVMLCDTSSIIYEFMFLDKPVVTFNTRTPGDFVLDISELDEILPAIEKVYNDSSVQLLAAKECIFSLNEFYDGQSSKRVIDAIEEVLSSKLKDLKPKPLNLLRKFKLRKRLSYWRF